MNDAQILARVLELDVVIGRLQKVRDAVGGFSVDSYKDAGRGSWAGQKRNQFVDGYESAKTSHSRIGDQIGDAIGECKSKQRTLAFSINVLEHPEFSAQAIAIALT